MARLDPKDGYAVLINTFRVAPERAGAHIVEAGKVATSFDPVIFELRYSDSAEARR
jgi:hypothetical protein